MRAYGYGHREAVSRPPATRRAWVLVGFLGLVTVEEAVAGELL